MRYVLKLIMQVVQGMSASCAQQIWTTIEANAFNLRTVDM